MRDKERIKVFARIENGRTASASAMESGARGKAVRPKSLRETGLPGGRGPSAATGTEKANRR